MKGENKRKSNLIWAAARRSRCRLAAPASGDTCGGEGGRNFGRGRGRATGGRGGEAFAALRARRQTTAEARRGPRQTNQVTGGGNPHRWRSAGCDIGRGGLRRRQAGRRRS